MESYRVGSVAWSMKHFPRGPVHARAPSARPRSPPRRCWTTRWPAYAPDRWDVAYGASGTIGAVGDVLAAAGGAPGVVTREGLDWLLRAAAQGRQRRPAAHRWHAGRPQGRDRRRRERAARGVRPAGDRARCRSRRARCATACCTNCWNATTASPTCAAPRCARLASRFAADAAQAQRVGDTAAALFLQLEPAARGASTGSRAGRALRKLGWAAQLHEIGCADLAQRIPQARRLHPRQRRRAGLRGQRDALARASWCSAIAASCASSRRRWTTKASSRSCWRCGWP